MSDRAEDVRQAHRDLVNSGMLEPLTPGGDDERAWRDCDLASFAENRLGDCSDPRAIGPDRRDIWESRVSTERLCMPSERTYERCYWLLDGGERTGTVALSKVPFGAADVRLTSFYVYPPHRHERVSARTFEAIRRTLLLHRLGLSLETSWNWQRTVRWWLRAGLWVHKWKRDLELGCRPGEPAPILEVGAHRATLAIERAGERLVLSEAERVDGRLSMDDGACEIAADLGELAWHAHSTLSLAIALEGWPLVRSRETWDAAFYWADAVAPESLAQRIQSWEAWNRRHGWLVETPRIPGLEYPTWTELEEQWARCWSAERPQRCTPDTA